MWINGDNCKERIKEEKIDILIDVQYLYPKDYGQGNDEGGRSSQNDICPTDYNQQWWTKDSKHHNKS